MPSRVISSCGPSDQSEINLSSRVNETLAQHNEVFDIVLRDIIQQYLFPKVKFVNKTTDLMFSISKKSVCGVIFEQMNLSNLPIDQKAVLWTNNIYRFARGLQFHRNNIIRKIKNWVLRKYCYIVYL